MTLARKAALAILLLSLIPVLVLGALLYFAVDAPRGPLLPAAIVACIAAATGAALYIARTIGNSTSALERSERRFRSVAESASDAIILADSRGVILSWNKGAGAIFGYAPEEIVGKPLALLMPERYREAHRQGLQRLSVTGEARILGKTLEVHGVRKSGEEFSMELCVDSWTTVEGRFFSGILRDITGRKNLEAERDRYFTHSPDLICIAGKDGYFKRLNAAWEHVLGYALPELMTRSYWELVHPEDLPAAQAQARKVFEEGGAMLSFECRMRHRDGSWRWCSWSSPAAAPGEDTVYVAGRDIAEQKRVAEEIVRVNGELEAFTYSVSHDLRAPLRAIDGFSRILVGEHTDRLTDEGRRLLKVITDNARHMEKLIDDLLEFSRAGRTAIRTVSVDVDALAREVLDDQLAAVRNRKIETRIATLPAAQADEALLRQVFVNLLSNAIKYTRPREEAVVEVGSRSQDGEPIYFVKDNGVGFDMKHASKLFGVFQRLHRADEFEGTGVGLALVQRIIQRHGGRVWGEGAVDQGATFSFSLPRSEKST